MIHARKSADDRAPCEFTDCPGHDISTDELDQMAAELLLLGWRREGRFWTHALQGKVSPFTTFIYTQHAYVSRHKYQQLQKEFG